MNSPREQRIKRELRQLQAELPYGITVFEDPVDKSHLIAVLRGPLNSSYEHGYFVVDIVNPISYPFHPSRVKFCTKVWHPNVSPDSGKFCMDLLQDKWSPALYLEKVLLLVQSFIDSPMLESPTDVVNLTAAEMFSRDPTAFQSIAREWTEQYALSSPPSPELVAQWFAQPLTLVGTPHTSNPSLVARSTRVSNFTDPVLDPPIQAAPLPQVPPISSAVSAPSPIAVPLVPPPAASTPPAPPSWLALLLEGRTTPAFVVLCELKLIQQEDFSSAELLASVPESEFTCEYLTSIGITAKGLQIKLVSLHKELRAAHREVPSVRHASSTPASTNPAELAAQLVALAVHEGDDRMLDPVYVSPIPTQQQN